MVRRGEIEYYAAMSLMGSKRWSVLKHMPVDSLRGLCCPAYGIGGYEPHSCSNGGNFNGDGTSPNHWKETEDVCQT